MGGVDTSRGIAYQNAQAVLTALDVLRDADAASLRVEGQDDILDIEVLGHDGTLLFGKQVKTRLPHNPWAKGPILTVLHRWLSLDIPGAKFEFVTDGPLGASATELQDALTRASQGEYSPLATFLGVDENDASLKQWGRVSVRRDVNGSEAVLSVAEHEVRSLLPGGRTQADLHDTAKNRVNSLHRELANRAGNPDPDQRLVTKHQIQEFLGGVRGIPEEDRWTQGARHEYLSYMAKSSVDLIDMRLSEVGETENAPDLPVSQLIDDVSPKILSARTGAGKTSAAKVAARIGALRGQAVLVVHAEAYVATRLSALVAETLSQMLARPLPTITGEQALGDSSFVLIIDGASEIPDEMRDALRTELRTLVAHNGAKIVLIGRDQAVLLTLLPISSRPQLLTLTGLDRRGHASLAARELADKLMGLAEADRDIAIESTVRRLEETLGDAAGNPMLFTMALQTLGDDEAALTEASLYSASITQMFQRAHVADTDITSTSLGMVFAELLDLGRRFVYPHEYRRMLASSVEALSDTYFGANVEKVEENIRASGLLSPLGADQVLVPVHDSYADYLAGFAYTREVASMPAVLTRNDERRVEFAMQLGKVDDLAVQVCRDIPYSVVRVSRSDYRPVSRADSPQLIYSALEKLLPVGDSRSPVLWRQSNLVLVALDPHSHAGWADTSPAAQPRAAKLKVVADPEEGVLSTVVRLWRATLKANLKASRELPCRHPVSPEDAAELVMSHVRSRGKAIVDLAEETLSPTAAKQVLDDIGTLGIFARISRTSDHWNGHAMIYRSADEIDVQVVDGELEESLVGGLTQGYGSTGAESLLRDSPQADAADILRSHIEHLTESAWLQ